jgi:hypothetical protein
MRAALLVAALAILSGCISVPPPDRFGRWPKGTRFDAAAPLSGSARAMDYYARRWSSTDLGPAFGWKLLDPADAKAQPWAPPGQRGGGTLDAMRAANEAEALRLGLSGTVRTAPGVEGLMPLQELAAEPGLRKEPWLYLPWYQIEAGNAGPWGGEGQVLRLLRAQGRPDLARRYESGYAVGVLGSVLLGVSLGFGSVAAALPYPPFVLAVTLGTLTSGAIVLGGAHAENSAASEHNAALERLRAPPRPQEDQGDHAQDRALRP